MQRRERENELNCYTTDSVKMHLMPSSAVGKRSGSSSRPCARKQEEGSGACRLVEKPKKLQLVPPAGNVSQDPVGWVTQGEGQKTTQCCAARAMTSAAPVCQNRYQLASLCWRLLADCVFASAEPSAAGPSAARQEMGVGRCREEMPQAVQMGL